MSTSAAKSHARRAQAASTVEEKIDALADAIYHLARAIDDIETVVKRIPR